MKKGYFVTFEGPEGSGKTTVVNKLYDELKKEGYEVILTREPGGIEISEQIRKVILDVNNTKMDSKTEALLYAAARRQHLVEKVIPAIEEGKIIICDRFVHSSLAYQGVGRGIGVDEVMEINKFAIDSYMPDLTLYFDLDPEVGLERINKNKDREVNRLDKESLDFHYKIRNAYLNFEKDDQNMVKIDASKSVEEVFENVLKEIKKVI